MQRNIAGLKVIKSFFFYFFLLNYLTRNSQCGCALGWCREFTFGEVLAEPLKVIRLSDSWLDVQVYIDMYIYMYTLGQLGVGDSYLSLSVSGPVMRVIWRFRAVES